MRAGACLLLGLGLTWSPVGAAGTVHSSDVRYQDGVYRVDMEMAIDADIASVRDIITDYAGLARISDLIVRASLEPPPQPGGVRRRMDTRMCMLIFCFDAVMVEDVMKIDDNTVITVVVPQLSDFRFGRSRWRLQKLAPERTLLEFRTEMEPDFWIPPLIGPLLVKHKLLREAEKTITRIENLARE